jgi:hypothetical protein
MKKLVSSTVVWLGALALASAQGPIQFQEHFSIATHGAPRGLAYGDFDLDGHLDFAAASFGQPSHDIVVWFGDGTGIFGREMVISLDQPNAGPFAIAAGDLNHDGHADLAVTLADNDRIAVLLWRNGGFVRNPDIVLQPPANPREIQIADMNRDGNNDLVITNYERGNVEVREGTGDGVTFGTILTGNVGRGAHGLAVADLNHDGLLDLAVTNALTNQLWVMFRGAGTDYTGEPYPTGGSPRQVVAADLNHDGRKDLAVVNTTSNSLTIYFWNPLIESEGDAPIFTARQDIAGGNSPRDLEAVDANGDGLNDLAVASYTDNKVIVINGAELLGAPASRFTIGSFTNPRSLVTADFNEDGRPDLLVANQANGFVRLFTNASAFFARP